MENVQTESVTIYYHVALDDKIDYRKKYPTFEEAKTAAYFKWNYAPPDTWVWVYKFGATGKMSKECDRVYGIGPFYTISHDGKIPSRRKI